MCGLSGLIIQASNGFTNTHIQASMANIFITQLRGMDSTGVVGVSNKGFAAFLKDVGPPHILFNNDAWKKFQDGLFSEGQLVFGHNRAATKGDVTIENAHPFACKKKDGKGKIMLIHNGTLYPHQTLPGLKDFNVDSEWLTDCVAKYGADESFKKINGPIASIWWDTEDKTINIFRNHERPLHYAREKTSGDIYINSEIAPLMWLKHQYHLEFDVSDIKQFDANHHYSLKHGDLRAEWTKKNLTKPVVHYGSNLGNNILNATTTLGRRRLSRLGDQRIISVAEWKTKERSFQSDCEDIQAGRLEKVSFNETVGYRWRMTELPHGSQFVCQDVAPYKDCLVSMEIADDLKRVLCSYADGKGTTWTHEIVPQKSNVIVIPNNRVEENLAATTPMERILGGEFVKGSKRKWKFNDKKLGKITHWVKVSKDHRLHFSQYFNSVDGKFSVGDEFKVEAYDYVLRNQEDLFYEVYCSRILPDGEADNFVDFYFFSKGKTKLELQAEGFFVGTVARMRLAEAPEYRTKGNIISIQMENVQPILDITDTEEAESAGRVVFPDGANVNAY
jgi:hypothetical protein